MKRFVTLFPNARNIHLVKDVGQIPLQMQKHYNYESSLVCYKNEDYTYLNNEAKGLKIYFLKNCGKLFFWEKGVLRYLKKQSKNIDVLNLYHLTQESLLYGLRYKYLNPQGILYLKLDFDYSNYRNGITFSGNPWKEFIYKKMYARFKKMVDIVSVEAKRGYQMLKQLDEELQQKTIVLTNGTDIEQIRNTAGQPRIEKKEDLILTVGRIGTKQKNNELLLKAIAEMALKNWQVKFIGPIEEHFKPKIERFFQKNSDKRRKVHFVGKIADRRKLFQWYKKAKICCLTSRWESFGLVLAEGQTMGNYIIATNVIPPINNLTDQGKLGSIIESENVVQLKESLKKAMHPGFYNEPLMNAVLKHSRNYDWPFILKKLDKQIKKAAQSR